MAWKYQVGHFLIIEALIIFLNIGLQQRNPLTCWNDMSFLEQITFASLMVIPFSVFTAILHLQMKWKISGEQNLLAYLNATPRPYMKPVLLIVTWVLLVWIVHREILWPYFIKQNQQETYRPIKLNHPLGTLIYQPHQTLNQGELLVIHHKKMKYYKATMLGSQWQLSHDNTSDPSIQLDALNVINQWIPNKIQLRIIMGQEHQLSVFELFHSSVELTLKIWIIRFFMPLMVWALISFIWISVLHRPNQAVSRLGLGFVITLVMVLLSHQMP